MHDAVELVGNSSEPKQKQNTLLLLKSEFAVFFYNQGKSGTFCTVGCYSTKSTTFCTVYCLGAKNDTKAINSDKKGHFALFIALVQKVLLFAFFEANHRKVYLVWISACSRSAIFSFCRFYIVSGHYVDQKIKLIEFGNCHCYIVTL